MSKRILILTDSLALPRTFPEVCEHEFTWPENLKSQGHVIHQVSIGGATSRDLLNQIPYHKSFKPDVVILQVGIVDCAPRFLKKYEINLLRKIPYLGNKIIQKLNNKWVKKYRKLSYISPFEFRDNIKGIVSSFDNAKIFILGIIPASMDYENLLPGVTQNIRAYNSILKSFNALFFDLETILKNGIMSDHHHLNREGHKYIAKIIKESLNA